MKMKLIPQTADEMVYRLELDLPLHGWKELLKAIDDSSRSPVWEFRNAIRDAVYQADREFHGTGEEKSES